MSETQDVASLLAKLDKSLNKFKGKKDWAAINAERKKAFFKPKVGKNQIMVMTPEFGTDPFTIWGFHNNLQEVSYYSVPCDEYNQNEDCVICNVVNSLKKENFEGNKHLWLPIEQKTEYYAPIINLESQATILEGPKWMRISKTIMNQMVEWLKNLEEGEVPFFDALNPARVLITYNNMEAPATQYKLEQKPLKEKFSTDQVAEWSGVIRPVGEFIAEKSQDEIKKLVDEYFARIAETVEDSMSEDQGPEVTGKSKLDKLKA